MSREIHVQNAAYRDIDRHADYIAGDDPVAARRFVQAVRADVAWLAEMPGLGGLCELQGTRYASWRVWSIRGFENYLIYYREAETKIDVIRILHGAMDIESELRRS
jgi:toxin ParE1/3/4